MNINILEKIKEVENTHNLEILLFDNNLDVSYKYIYDINKTIGHVTVATNSYIKISELIGRLGNQGITFVLNTRIPIKTYDILISTEFTKVEKLAASNLKINYLAFLNFVKNFDLDDYFEFQENTYKRKIPTEIKEDTNHLDRDIPKDEIEVNDQDNYEIFIKELASTPIKYDRYRINYLMPAIPGKVSIIMIVNKISNHFADVIRDIKAQNYGLIEFIIIDNAAGFRNNVKPSIRYGVRMSDDFCKYHGKEISSGEFLIILNEESPFINILDTIKDGKYETR